MTRSRSFATLLTAALLVSAVPTLAGEASPSPAIGSPAALELEGTTWRLVKARLSGAYTDIPGDVTATLQLVNGQAGGSGGCNQWFASYTLDGQGLTFGDVGSTLMLCEGPAGDIETFYLADLASVATWAIDGTSLVLSGADGEPVLAFEAEEGIDLTGDWIVTDYNDGAGTVSTIEDFEVTLTFEDGMVSGNAGCNTFSGTFTQSGDSIVVGELIQTAMACEPAAIMELEAAVSEALAASTALRQEPDGSVGLLDAAGTLQLTIERTADAQTPRGLPAELPVESPGV